MVTCPCLAIKYFSYITPLLVKMSDMRAPQKRNPLVVGCSIDTNFFSNDNKDMDQNKKLKYTSIFFFREGAYHFRYCTSHFLFLFFLD